MASDLSQPQRWPVARLRDFIFYTLCTGSRLGGPRIVFAQLLAYHLSLRMDGVINRVVQGVRMYD